MRDFTFGVIVGVIGTFGFSLAVLVWLPLLARFFGTTEEETRWQDHQKK
jgi:hypothetical protein